MMAYTYTSNDLSGLLNDAIDVYIGKLTTAGIITEEKKAELQNYRMVVADRNFFGRLWFKLTSKEDQEIYYELVKVIK